MKLALCLSFAAALCAQGLDPALLTKPLANDWPTYNGDYSGQRYSRLTQINQTNVKNLTLAWTTRVTSGMGATGGPVGRGGFGGRGRGCGWGRGRGRGRGRGCGRGGGEIGGGRARGGGG